MSAANAELSDATLKQAENRQKAVLNNINQLQKMEQDLYKKLEVAAANNAGAAEQEAIVKKINELSAMRMTMFTELDGMYKSMQGRVAQSRIDLVDQMTVTGVMEQELNNAKKNLNVLRNEKANKMRMVEINSYYASKYRAQGGLMKLVIMVCIPLLLLAIVAKKGWIPDNLSKVLIAIVLVVGGFFIFRRYVDLVSRSNMNYDEYVFAWDPDANDPTVFEYDKQQLDGTSIQKTLEDDVNDFAKDVGIGCVGSACCSKGMKYDDKKNVCIEAFQGGRPPVSYVESSPGMCPFKQATNTVVPFSNTQTNYVKV